MIRTNFSVVHPLVEEFLRFTILFLLSQDVGSVEETFRQDYRKIKSGIN
jgi:hypothetical protein